MKNFAFFWVVICRGQPTIQLCVLTWFLVCQDVFKICCRLLCLQKPSPVAVHLVNLTQTKRGSPRAGVQASSAAVAWAKWSTQIQVLALAPIPALSTHPNTSVHVHTESVQSMLSPQGDSMYCTDSVCTITITIFTW